MQSSRMVRLTTVRSTFHARVIAARLGAEGMLTELRGAVDGPYPMGEVHVFVSSADADAARELLLVDEVESAFDSPGLDPARQPGHHPAPALWVLVAAVVLVASLALARGF
jgi:hypothetical protein